ncbi:hypothetical protein [Sinorhizobium fredii]|nr:hypothetical protein [Sinorhizobium fredii]
MSVDPPQPSPRDLSGGPSPLTPEPGDRKVAEETSIQEHHDSNEGTGGDAWNNLLGNTTNAGMLRLLFAIGLFILVAGTFFWLVA